MKFEKDYLFEGDCVEILESFPKETIDLIFADPPYGISSHSMISTSFNGYSSRKGRWDMFLDDYDTFTKNWIFHCCRVLRQGGSIYVSGVFASLVPVYQYLESFGMKFQSQLIWHKTNPAPCLQRRNYTYANEIILFYTKGSNWTFNYDKSKTYNKGKQLHNVWNLASTKKIGGVTTKPKQLLERIVEISSNKGDVVLDPFLGSGTTMEVCQSINRHCIGIELQNKLCEIILSRCKKPIEFHKREIVGNVN